MPTYKYRCTNCKRILYLDKHMMQEHRKKCPKCHHRTLEPMPNTVFSIHYKGKGWGGDG